MAKSRAAGVKGHGNIIWGFLPEEFAYHSGKTIHGIHRLALRAGKVLDGIKGLIEKRVSINEEEFLGHRKLSNQEISTQPQLRAEEKDLIRGVSRKFILIIPL